MNLRTIQHWVIYDPKNKHIVAARKYKYQIEKLHLGAGFYIVKMKGHYAASPRKENE